MGIITERERHELRQWADEAMGEDRADILMRSLPPRGWDDLATKADVEASREATRQEIRFATEQVRADVHQQSARLLLMFVTLMLGTVVGEQMLPHWFPPPAPQIIVQTPASE